MGEVLCRCGKPIGESKGKPRKWCSVNCYHRENKKQKRARDRVEDPKGYKERNRIRYRKRRERESKDIKFKIKDRERCKKWAARQKAWMKERNKRYYWSNRDKINRRSKSYIKKKREFENLIKMAWDLEQLGQTLEQAMAEKRESNETPESIKAKCGKLKIDRLREILKDGIKLIRENLLWCAFALQELEVRGERPEGERWLFAILRRIASGEMLVDVMVRFAGRPEVMSVVSKMPVARQQEMLTKSNEEVEHIVYQDKKKRREERSHDVVRFVEDCFRRIDRCPEKERVAAMLIEKLTLLLSRKAC